MKKDYSIIISIAAISFSLVTLIMFFIKVSPNSIVDSNTFISICTAFIGISVTLIIGFQIGNTLQIKTKISELKETSVKLQSLLDESNKKTEMQSCLMQEGFDYISAIVKYHREGQRSSADAFQAFHHTLIWSLQTERTEYEWIFQFMRNFLSEIDYTCFGEGRTQTLKTGEKIDGCGRNMKDILEEYNKKVREDENIIRNLERFPVIKIEYNRMIRVYKAQIQRIEQNPPTSILSIDEKAAIREGRC